MMLIAMATSFVCQVSEFDRCSKIAKQPYLIRDQATQFAECGQKMFLLMAHMFLYEWPA